MTKTHLVYGRNSIARENAIAAMLVPNSPSAVIIEGIANGTSKLEEINQATNLAIHRIAPGCPCCTGSLTMRVTLNRLLRKSPEYLYISLASNEHLTSIREFLQAPQYKDLLTLQEECNCDNSD
jgi:G3E family GTPase